MSSCSVPLRTRLFHTTEARLRAAGHAGIDHQFRGPGDVQFGVFDSKFNDPELLKHHVSCRVNLLPLPWESELGLSGAEPAASGTPVH